MLPRPFRCLVALAASFPCPAPAEDPPDLSALLAKVRETHRLPAIACVVFRDGKTIEEAAVGVRKSGSPETVTLGDRFHIGSITKSMTSTLAAICVAEKKLRWSSTVREILGPSIPKIEPAYQDVTLLDLLQHRGGAPHDPPAALWSELWKRGDQPAAENRAWFVAAILGEKPAQARGTFSYSNTGYMIAGHMLETVTGKPWENLIRERLFQPLRLTGAGFGAPATAGKIDQPWGHADGKPVPPGPQADNPPALGPAGTVHCTVRELARYAALHLGTPDPAFPMLDRAAFDVLHTPPPGDLKNPYAAGWSRLPRPWANGDALTHNGCNTMNYAVVWLAPRRNFGLVVVSNEGRGSVAKALDEIASAMVAKHCPGPDPAK